MKHLTKEQAKRAYACGATFRTAFAVLAFGTGLLVSSLKHAIGLAIIFAVAGFLFGLIYYNACEYEKIE